MRTFTASRMPGKVARRTCCCAFSVPHLAVIEVIAKLCEPRIHPGTDAIWRRARSTLEGYRETYSESIYLFV